MFWQIQEKVKMYKSNPTKITEQGSFHILSIFFFLMANISLGKFAAFSFKYFMDITLREGRTR